MTTKEQEYKALAKIQKIIADLETDGEKSYIGTALEGALSLAETNIRDDFGDSAKFFIDGYYEQKKRAEELESQVAELKAEIDALTEKTLVYDDAKMFGLLLHKEIRQHEEEAQAAAEKIVELATQPDCREFKEAVEANRKAKRNQAKFEGVREWLTEKYGV